jgi:hypothetical protein
MDVRHLAMWQIVDSAAAVPAALENAPPWSTESSEFATIR